MFELGAHLHAFALFGVRRGDIVFVPAGHASTLPVARGGTFSWFRPSVLERFASTCPCG